jgi:hypothetical protein
MTEESEFESRLGKEFSLRDIVQTSRAVHPTYPMDIVGSFRGVKRHESEADHSTPTSAEIKKTWICTYAPLYVFMA